MTAVRVSHRARGSEPAMNSRFTLAATLRSNRLPFQPPLCFFRSKSTVHLFGVLTEISIPVRKPSDFSAPRRRVTPVEEGSTQIVVDRSGS